ncbi:MAG: acyl-CoA dehydrogenase [Alphaproteobacteria bacterium]|nr:acyl-CoA dehydrogenase [Alphaproteobacteria bacterium]
MTDEYDKLTQHIGRKITASDVATAAPMRGMIVTFDRDEHEPAPGQAIPPGWHTMYFLPMFRPAELAADGLAISTGVIPKMPFPRRMFAGTRMRFLKPIHVGEALTRETILSNITIKRGNTGTLAFVTVTHRISTPAGLAVEEENDSVFREEVPQGAKSGIPKHESAPADTPWRQTHHANEVSLFRFSALTFNGHRIHYDRPYATEVEGYPGLVVHGPYSSTLLLNFARDHNPGRAMTSFQMRARAPLFDTAPVTLVGRPEPDGTTSSLWSLTPEGTIAMSSTATFA